LDFTYFDSNPAKLNLADGIPIEY